MNLLKSRVRQAFTLMELMIVVLLIGFLVLLLTKGFSAVANKSALADCAVRMKDIGTAIKSQATANNGRFSDNPGGYVTEFDGAWERDPTKSEGDSGYYYKSAEAFEVDMFTCPTDRNPFYMTSGYKTSYPLSNAFIGTRMASMAGGMTLLSEVGKRHLVSGNLAVNYLFGDLRIQTSGPHPSLPEMEIHMQGLRSRIWNNATTTMSATQPKAEMVWSSDLYWHKRNGLHFLPKEEYDRANGWSDIPKWNYDSPGDVEDFHIVLDGYLNFPSEGTWDITVRAKIGSNGTLRSRTGLDGDVKTQANGTGNPRELEDVQVFTVNGTLIRAVEFHIAVGEEFTSFEILWNKSGESPKRIKSNDLSHVPFERTLLVN